MLSAGSLAQEKLLYSFGNKTNDGQFPLAGLVFDSSGNLFGTTGNGGTDGLGTVFELSPTKTTGFLQRVLFSFHRIRPGVFPTAGLAVDASGNLYGTANQSGISGGGVAFELKHWPSGGWSEKVLDNFGGPNGAPTHPDSNLIFDAAGNAYGTTSAGGHPEGGGTVFMLSPASDGTWSETVLHDFTPSNHDGWDPSGGLVFDAASNLYGTTYRGGTNSRGTVYEVSPAGDGTWTEKILYNFTDAAGDGGFPKGGLIFDAAGNLYGTTSVGGNYNSTGKDCLCPSGTVFELSPATDGAWTETVLYTFKHNGSDGILPSGNLIFDASGNLYGTTLGGGAYGNVQSNPGTVFKLSPVGAGRWAETILHSFGSGKDGSEPTGSLIFDGSGNLYGTTDGGGRFGYGTVFEITP